MSFLSSSNNNRIAKNSLLLYFRMIIVMLVSLYTSRVVLKQLGVVDFGVYNVVAGFVAMLGFFTSSLSNMTQRYLNVYLGSENEARCKDVFMQSHSIMLVICCIVFFVGEVLGPWFVSTQLVIPENRIIAAQWVFQFSLISILCSIYQVSFLGDIVANEQMGFYAYLGLFEAFAKLAIAYALFSSVDRLILYGALMAGISLMTTLFYVLYSCKKFPESRIKWYWEKKLSKSMFLFASVNVFGCFAYSIGEQGITIILNMFFGPIVNAARGIAVQIGAVVMRFTDSIMTAVKPQIIKSYAANDISYMIVLIEKSSKYSFFLSSMIAVPVLVECPIILHWWLENVPDYTLNFSRIVIVSQLFNVFVPPLWFAANATGNIKNNQIYGRIITLLALPLSYVLLKFYPYPDIPMLILLMASLGYWLYCLYDVHKQLGLSVFHYLKKVVIPSVLCFILCLLVGIGLDEVLILNDFLRLMVVFSAIVCVTFVCMYIFSTAEEKNFVFRSFEIVKKKIL